MFQQSCSAASWLTVPPFMQAKTPRQNFQRGVLRQLIKWTLQDYGNARWSAAASTPTVPSAAPVNAPTVDKKLESGVTSALVA